jgi:TRAP-type C4-dicarboxylate transport system substrate-binding protein
MQFGGMPPHRFEKVKGGVADVIGTLPGYTAGRFPLNEVFDLPFTMQNQDVEATSKALWDCIQHCDAAEFKDVRPIALHVHRHGVLHMHNRPIRTIDDSKGTKVRAHCRFTNAGDPLATHLTPHVAGALLQIIESAFVHRPTPGPNPPRGS